LNGGRNHGVSATFNVADFSPFLEDDHLANLRANSPQEGEDDGVLSMPQSLRPQKGPISSSSTINVEGIVQVLPS